MAKGKERLDKLLVQRGLVESRARAQAYIMAGEVLVNGEPAVKAGMAVPLDAELTVKESLQQFASRGGLKLAGALDEFAIPVAGRVGGGRGRLYGRLYGCIVATGCGPRLRDRCWLWAAQLAGAAGRASGRAGAYQCSLPGGAG